MMDSDRRLLLALVLIIGFLYVWFEYLVPKPAPKIPEAPPAVVSPAATPEEKVYATEENSPRRVRKPAIAPILVTTETSLVSRTWTNQPGSPHNIRLKKFHVTSTPTSPLVEVVPFQRALEPPLLWKFDVGGKIFSDEGAVYETGKEVLDHSLVYKRQFGSNLSVQKTFSWKDDSYALDQEVVVTNLSAQSVTVKASTTLSSGIQPPKKTSFFSMMGAGEQPLRAVAYVNEKALFWTMEDVRAQKKPVPPGDIGWAGLDAHYFFLTAVPVEARWSGLALTAKKPLQADAQDSLREQAEVQMRYPAREIAPKGNISYRVRVYAGPKDIGSLRATHATLDRAIDLGDWLGPIARPILLFLRWLYSLLPNYGIAIILLTAMVRLLMYPLTQMQAKSMRRMQEHKPQMDALKEKYGKDKEAYSRELMNYMKTHRINPMGGCLLLLPQLPVFFALYRVLYNSIELRHAPFALWIKDLSAHDPYFVLPIVLGISMFLQQKLTPSPTADPAQQSMMKIMPVMFSVFMLFLPAGLNLYIFVSTLLGVAQQYWVQRQVVGITGAKEKARKL